MSASKDKIRRQEAREAGLDLVKNDDKAKADQKFRRVTKIVVICLVIFAVVVTMFSSGLVYKTFTAAEIGADRYTVADVNYYYTSIYNKYYSQYYNSYGTYATYMMPERKDMVTEALNALQEVTMLCAEAEKAGYELDETGRSRVEAEIDGMRAAAKENGVSVAAYLGTVYGKGMTEKAFRRNVERGVLAVMYGASLREGYEYSAEELTSHYQENRDRFDIITSRVFLIPAEKLEDGTYNLDASDREAQKFADKVTDEQSFIDLAYEYAAEDSKEAYEDENATLYKSSGRDLNDAYKEWMLDSSRKLGDITTVRATTGTYVLFYVSRDSNAYQTVNVRHILVSYEANESGTVDEAAKDAAYAEAERIYQEWKDGEATEESFAELASQYSGDGSASEGGLYENVYKNQMVTPFNDWCYSASRQPGDTAIVETEYGCHVMYFVGQGERYCDYLASNELRNNDYNAWTTETKQEYEIQKTWVSALAGN